MKKTIILVLISGSLAGFLTLGACGGGGGGSDTPGPQTLASVSAYYTNGADWNDYVKNNGPTIFEATNTASTGTETGGSAANIHGGEMRAVAVIGLSDCADVTAEDALGAFDWVCYEGTDPVTVVSTGLADGAYLSSLIDFDAQEWRDNSLTVFNNGNVYGSTPASAWWSNPVVPDNDGGRLWTEGTIYIVNFPARFGSNYIIEASKVGLVIDPEQTFEGAGVAGGQIVLSAGKSFLWFEGNVTANRFTPENYGVYLSDVRFSKVFNVTSSNNGVVGVYFVNSPYNVLSNVTAVNNGMYGVFLGASSYNNLSDITANDNDLFGVYLQGTSTNNTLYNVTSTNNTVEGIRLQAASNNTLTKVILSNNVENGMVIDFSGGNTLSDIIAANNGGSGVIIRSSGCSNCGDNILNGVTAVNNGEYGVHLSVSPNNILTEVAAANNMNHGIFLNAVMDNTLQNIAATNNGGYGVFETSSSRNLYYGKLKAGYNGSGDFNLAPASSAAGADSATGVTVENSFIGPVVTDDTVNISDSNGVALYDSITDWSSFENPHRAWGKDGAAFSSTVRGAASGGGDCRIWDWSLAAVGDTGDAGGPALLSVLQVPDPSNSLTHTWFGGATFGFLANAKEIFYDGVGDEDGLCEGDEDCLETPNIGSYQGQGDLILMDLFPFQAGNVNIYAHSTNGY